MLRGLLRNHPDHVARPPSDGRAVSPRCFPSPLSPPPRCFPMRRPLLSLPPARMPHVATRACTNGGRRLGGSGPCRHRVVPHHRSVVCINHTPIPHTQYSRGGGGIGTCKVKKRQHPERLSAKLPPHVPPLCNPPPPRVTGDRSSSPVVPRVGRLCRPPSPKPPK